MNEPTIRLSQVFKRFRRGERMDSLRDLAARCMRRCPRDSTHDFWALRDVNFAVGRGEAFGIVGPNGAGKSTVLKLLAGILRPTHGQLVVHGRVSALIELGAGFHGDLTGRENIYLNASILGMSRKEARSKFGQIAEFADIGEFLDTPLKRYSSGMHARLGFAIAAHADPQVLLVDEVLSVGDRVFRAKCMDKMKGFLREGAAVVFVSHDLGTVNRFCHRALVLDRGQSRFCGAASQAIGLYYDACTAALVRRTVDGSSPVRFWNIQLSSLDDRPISAAQSGDRIRFTFDVEFQSMMESPSYGLSLIRHSDHMVVFETSSTRLGCEAGPVLAGDRQRVEYELDLNVAPGQYALGLHVRDRDSLEYAAESAYAAQIIVDSPLQTGGVVHVNPSFKVLPLQAAAACAALV